MSRMFVVWQEREAAMGILHADPGTRNLTKNSEINLGTLNTREFKGCAHRFAESHVGQRDVRIIDGHQTWHLEALQGDGSRGEAMVHLPVHQG